MLISTVWVFPRLRVFVQLSASPDLSAEADRTVACCRNNLEAVSLVLLTRIDDEKRESEILDCSIQQSSEVRTRDMERVLDYCGWWFLNERPVSWIRRRSGS